MFEACLSVSTPEPLLLKLLATGVAAEDCRANIPMVGPVRDLADLNLVDVRPVMLMNLFLIRKSME